MGRKYSLEKQTSHGLRWCISISVVIPSIINKPKWLYSCGFVLYDTLTLYDVAFWGWLTTLTLYDNIEVAFLGWLTAHATWLRVARRNPVTDHTG